MKRHALLHLSLIAVIIALAFHSPAFAVDATNPVSPPLSTDWTGTANDDNYLNLGTINANIDMTQGGSDIVTNNGTVGYSIFMSYEGGNTVDNTNIVYANNTGVNGIFGTYNGLVNNLANLNDVTNSGIVYGSIYGSYNTADGAGSSYNVIENNVNGTVGGDIFGSYNISTGTSGGNNVISNNDSATVQGDIFGSDNLGDNSVGSDNSITNQSTVNGSIFGSANQGDNCEGGNNVIANTGTTGGTIFGSYNIGEASTGGANTITNTGTAEGGIFGSANYGYNTSGGGNTIMNSGTTADIIGSGNSVGSYSSYGGGSSGGENTIINSGTAVNIYGTNNGGEGSTGGDNNISNSGTITGSIYGTYNGHKGASGGGNTILNISSNSVDDSIFGSFNLEDNTSGGENSISNTGTVSSYIKGSENLGQNSSGGSNNVSNSGDAGVIFGSFNQGGNSEGGDNAVSNSGTVNGDVAGSYNSGQNSSGGSNLVNNSGAITGGLNGSANDGDGSSGGSNNIENSGTIVNELAGSYNEGIGSSGGSNSISNSGVVSDDSAGSFNLGTNSSGGSNTIVNEGTFERSLYGSINQGTGSSGGGNTICLKPGSSVGYDVYGTHGGTDTGIDTLNFYGGAQVGRNVGGFDVFNKLGAGVATIGGNLALNGADVFIEMYTWETQVEVGGDVTGATGALSVEVLGGDIVHGQTVDIFSVGAIDTWSSETITDELADWEFVLLDGQVTAMLVGHEDDNNSNTPSGAVTAGDLLPRQFNAYRSLLGQRLSNLFAPRPLGDDDNGGQGGNDISYRLNKSDTTGLAAGEAAQAARWGLWANGMVSVQRNTSGSSRYKGIVLTTLAGVDYIIADGLVAGLGLGHDQSWLDTRFNDGSFTSSGFSLTPYVAWAILDNLIWDVSGAVGVVVNNQERNKSTFDYDSEYESYRTMIGTNINYYHLWNDWSFNLGAGFMYANEYMDSYTEKGVQGLRAKVDDDNVYVGEFNFSGGVKYYFEYVAPYLNATYRWSPWMTEGDYSNDSDEVEVAFGIDLQPTDDVVISLEVSKSLMRNFVETTNAMCSFRVAF